MSELAPVWVALVVGLFASPLAASVTRMFTRKKDAVEVESIQAEITALTAKTMTELVYRLREENEELRETVEQLRVEVRSLRTALEGIN